MRTAGGAFTIFMSYKELDIEFRRILNEGFDEKFKLFCASLSSSSGNNNPTSRLALPYLQGIMKFFSEAAEQRCPSDIQVNIPENASEAAIAQTAFRCCESLIQESQGDSSDLRTAALAIGAVCYQIASNRKDPDAGLFLRTFVRVWNLKFK